MYIPPHGTEADSLSSAHRVPTPPGVQVAFPRETWPQRSTSLDAADAGFVAQLAGRQFSSDPVQNTNTSIGIAVGVLLGVFLIGVCAFLWVYRYSVRCGKRRKRRPRSRKGSKSSKASSDNGGEGEAAPAADPPATEAASAAA